MKAIILNAGKGTRLMPLTADRPKGLVALAGKPLLEYTIAFARAVGATATVVIGGFEGQKVQAHLNEHHPSIAYAHVDEYTRGNLGSLAAALDHLTEDFLLLNADHVYHRDIAERVKSQKNGITSFCDLDRTLGDDDMKVLARGVYIDQISKKLTNFSHGYTGMTYVSEDMLPLYRFTIEELLRETDGTYAVEMILGRISAQGLPVTIGDISGHGWLEIDTPAEHALAQTAILTNPDHYLS